MVTRSTIEQARTGADVPWWLKIPAVQVGGAQPELQAVFETFIAENGFVPIPIRATANFPEVMLASRMLLKALYALPNSRLTQFDRELIATAVSVENRCEVCVVGHANRLRAVSDDIMQVAILEINYRRADLTQWQRAIVDYAIELTKNPSAVERAGLDKLRAVGLTEEEIFQVNGIASYFNMNNRIMSGLGVAPQREAYMANRERAASV